MLCFAPVRITLTCLYARSAFDCKRVAFKTSVHAPETPKPRRSTKEKPAALLSFVFLRVLRGLGFYWHIGNNCNIEL
jgi:hypothetical protein